MQTDTGKISSWANDFFKNANEEIAKEIANKPQYSNIDDSRDEIEKNYKEYSLIMEGIIKESKKQVANKAANDRGKFPSEMKMDGTLIRPLDATQKADLKKYSKEIVHTDLIPKNLHTGNFDAEFSKLEKMVYENRGIKATFIQVFKNIIADVVKDRDERKESVEQIKQAATADPTLLDHDDYKEAVIKLAEQEEIIEEWKLVLEMMAEGTASTAADMKVWLENYLDTIKKEQQESEKIYETEQNRDNNDMNEEDLLDAYNSVQRFKTRVDIVEAALEAVDSSLHGGKSKKSKKTRKSKTTRKHRCIIQTGGNTGKLRKGYKYSGKSLKNGMPEILKVKSKK